MPKLYILSGFSLNMLPIPCHVHMTITESFPDAARAIVESARRRGREIISAVGHESTAKMLTELLGVEVKANRIMVKLEEGDTALIFQLFTRLPEGRVLNYGELADLMNRGLAKLLYLDVETLVK